jgi:hypothetical protein
MRPVIPLAALLATAAALCGCQGMHFHDNRCLDMPPSDSPVVARVGSATLTMAQVEKRLREQGSAAQRYNDAPALRRFIEDQVRFELLVQAALERGLDRDPDVIEAARKVMVRKLLQKDLGAQTTGDATAESALRAYYEAHIQDYQQPERRRIAQIQLAPTPEGRALAQNLADRLVGLSAGELLRQFRAFVAQHSLDHETRGRGGELGSFLSRDELVALLGQNFADEAFKPAAGEVAAGPVQSIRGWHVALVLAKRDSVARSLDEVRDEIRDRLLQSERAQLFDRYLRDIRQRYPVALYEDRLPDLTARLFGMQNETP